MTAAPHHTPDADLRGPDVPGRRGLEPRDTELHDTELLDEIVLYGELIIAASSSDGPLPPERIDRILGLDRVGAPASH